MTLYEKFTLLKDYTLHIRYWNEVQGIFYNPLGIDTKICRRIY